jgi:hypothetical protein
MKLFCLTIIVIASLVVCNAQDSKSEALTNKMVVDLVQAKFSADIIIKKIQTAPSVNFDTGTDALIKLKNSGVEEKIVSAMLDRAALSSPVRSSDSPRVEIDRNAVNVASTSANGSNSQEKEKLNKFTLKKKFFTFDLTGCKGVGDTIKCELRVTNNDKDMERELVYPYGSTPTMIDEKGNRINSATKTIAGHTGGREMLTEGVPVSVSVTFQGLKNPSTIIKLLTLPFSTTPVPSGPVRGVMRSDTFLVEFRDIPVTQ